MSFIRWQIGLSQICFCWVSIVRVAQLLDSCYYLLHRVPKFTRWQKRNVFNWSLWNCSRKINYVQIVTYSFNEKEEFLMALAETLILRLANFSLSVSSCSQNMTLSFQLIKTMSTNCMCLWVLQVCTTPQRLYVCMSSDTTGNRHLLRDCTHLRSTWALVRKQYTHALLIAICTESLSWQWFKCIAII